MIPASFDYVLARSLDEATSMFAQADADQLMLLAGGMSLIPIMKMRLARPAKVIDISRLAELGGVEVVSDGLRVGALATHARILRTSIPAEYALLHDAARVIGDPQVRNRGTFGGSLCYAHPATDWPGVFLAMDGEAVVVHSQGRRIVKAEELFEDICSTSLRPGEILKEVTLHSLGSHSGTAYSKARHQASGMTLVGVAACVSLNLDRTIQCVRIAANGVNLVPFRAHRLEEGLRGLDVGSPVIFEKCDEEALSADPIDNHQASGDFRRQLYAVHLKNALARASERARTQVSA